MNSLELKNRWPYLIILAIWMGYCALILLGPSTSVSANRFDISTLQVNLLKLTIALPLLLIWMVGFRGVRRLHQYVALIKHEPDGKALQYILIGLATLLAYVIVQFVLSAVPAYFRDTGWLNAAVAIRNQLPVLLAVVGFGYVLIGSFFLNKLIKERPSYLVYLAVGLIYIIFTVAFTWSFAESLQERIITNGIPNFGLEGITPLFTQGLPYLLAWFIGLLAVINIFNFATRVKGIFYRKPLRQLATGLVIVLLNSVAIQIISFTSKIASSGLGYILAIVYILLFVYALGFYLIYAGTSKLLRIEGSAD